MSVTLVATIAVGDFFTGPYLVFATFYLVPVVITAWFVGRPSALVVGMFAALAGAVSTALDPREVTAPVYLWNGVFRFITYALIGSLVDAERRAMATISELSTVDALTGMSNRRHFYDLAQAELQRARRTGEPLAVIYIDVDDLKLRNDTAGHQAGDDMLTEFADLARATFRSTDLMSRLGGDEFCFLLPGADMVVADEVLDRFVAVLASAPVPPILVSAGVMAGVVDAVVDADVQSIVHNADQLMYEAKSSGKGQRRSHPSLAPR